MERIQSKENGRIKEYGKLASSRKYREETGCFVLEGEKLFKEALRSGVAVEQVFVTPAYRNAHPETDFSGLSAFEVEGAAGGAALPVEDPSGALCGLQKT